MPNKTDPIVETIHAKHVFSQDELVDLSRELGRTCNDINTLESEKSAVTKDFASRIETKEIRRDSLVDKVTSGYEMRPTECLVMLDPKNRSKDYFRRDSFGLPGDFVERREMTQADFQLVLPNTEAEKSEIAKSVTSDPEVSPKE
jgi:hypothetical protein